MAKKALKPTYEDKAERLDTLKRGVMIEVIIPHDGLERGYQALKPNNVAAKMVEWGYWKIIEG